MPQVRYLSITHFTLFFCCTLLACHEGRRRSPSVSGIGEKTDFLTFQLNFQNIHTLSNNANKLINAEVELGQRPRTWIQSINGAVPVRCTKAWGFRDTTDGECIGTGTQRNRRSDVEKV